MTARTRLDVDGLTTILIVEDDAQIELLLRYNLEAEGYVTASAERGDHAEEQVQAIAPDLMLLDWMLPGLSGVEVCRRIRLNPKTVRLPIILLTGRSDARDRVQGLLSGADDFMVKPFAMHELLARVRALLRRSDPDGLSDGDALADRSA